MDKESEHKKAIMMKKGEDKLLMKIGWWRNGNYMTRTTANLGQEGFEKLLEQIPEDVREEVFVGMNLEKMWEWKMKSD